MTRSRIRATLPMIVGGDNRETCEGSSETAAGQSQDRESRANNDPQNDLDRLCKSDTTPPPRNRVGLLPSMPYGGNAVPRVY